VAVAPSTEAVLVLEVVIYKIQCMCQSRDKPRSQVFDLLFREFIEGIIRKFTLYTQRITLPEEPLLSKLLEIRPSTRKIVFTTAA
jgi:hypothetical protein